MISVFSQFPHLTAGFIGAPHDFSNTDGEEIQKIFPKYSWKRYKQVHGNTVVNAEFDECEADGSYTVHSNIGCHVLVGDCIGGVFYNEQTQEIAAVHAGWKGLAQKIFTKYLSKFQNVSGVHVALSPSLGPCCAQFSDPYVETPDFFHEHIEQRDEKYFVNLWAIAKQELLNAGIDEHNIAMPMCCTTCNAENWWSHRNGDKERNIAFIVKNQE